MVKPNVLYAVHIIRGRRENADSRLLETVRHRGSLASAKKRAMDALLAYPELSSDDFVLVREAKDGREIYRWP